MAQPLAHQSERVDLSTLPVGSRWRHIASTDVAKITDLYEDADQDLRAHNQVQYTDMGVRADVVLHGGELASGVPAGLLLRDKGLLVSFATRALSADQESAVHALGSGQAAVGNLYIRPWADALTELIAFVEGDVPSHWPQTRTAVSFELRTKVLKTRMTRGQGVPWGEFKAVALGEQQFPAIRGTTSDVLKAELLRAVHIAAAEQSGGQTSICDDAITWTDADLMVGLARPPIPALVGGVDDAAIRAVCGGGPPPAQRVEPQAIQVPHGVAASAPKPAAMSVAMDHTTALARHNASALFGRDAAGRGAVATSLAGDARFPPELRAEAAVGGDGWVDTYVAQGATMSILIHLALRDLLVAGGSEPAETRALVPTTLAPTLSEVVGLALPLDGSITMVDVNGALRITAGPEGFAAQQEGTGQTHFMVPCTSQTADLLERGIVIRGVPLVGVRVNGKARAAPATAGPTQKRLQAKTNAEGGQCFGCGSPKHTYAMCWAWANQDSCHKCGDVGHYGWACAKFMEERALEKHREAAYSRDGQARGKEQAGRKGSKGAGRQRSRSPDRRDERRKRSRSTSPRRSSNRRPRTRSPSRGRDQESRRSRGGDRRDDHDGSGSDRRGRGDRDRRSRSRSPRRLMERPSQGGSPHQYSPPGWQQGWAGATPSPQQPNGFDGYGQPNRPYVHHPGVPAPPPPVGLYQHQGAAPSWSPHQSGYQIPSANWPPPPSPNGSSVSGADRS